MMNGKRVNYKQRIIWGIYLLAFFSVICAVMMLCSAYASSAAGMIPAYFLIIATVLDIVWIAHHYYAWRAEVVRAIAKLEELYGILLQTPYPGKGNAPILERLQAVGDQLEGALNKALISSLALKQAEINALQSQINPHFLYNILDSIRGQALSEGVSEIADMIESLADYFRYCITKEDDVVTLADELKNVENYWVIQKYRFGSKISMQVIMDQNEICPDEYEIPKLILQPIVENAIFHGLETKLGQGNVCIRITRTDIRLIIIVTDDGIGMKAEELNYLRDQLKEKQRVITKKESMESGRSGIALVNVNERIKLHYGDEYGLQISSTPLTGTEVEFLLPLCITHDHKEQL